MLLAYLYINKLILVIISHIPETKIRKKCQISSVSKSRFFLCKCFYVNSVIFLYILVLISLRPPKKSINYFGYCFKYELKPRFWLLILI